MADQETIVEQTEEVKPQAADIWGDTPKPQEQTQVQEEVKETVQQEVKQDEEEIIEPNVWLEREFGWKDAQSAKTEIEQLRKLREAKPEITFANDESKRLYEAMLAGKEDEVYSVLEQKKKFQKAESLNVEDSKQAAQLLQLSYQLKYKDLSQSEIADLFDEKYQKPEKPEQELTQTDEEYKATLNQWQAKCEAIDKKIVRDAKIERPDVLKLKTEIVFPDIPKKEETQTESQPSQEDLLAAEKFKNEFLQTATKSVNEFKGFTAQVKNKDVDFTVSYVPSIEEKAAVENTLKSIAEVGFNVNNLFAQRWTKEDGTIDTAKMVNELAFLDNKEKVLQKVAMDAANQRLEMYLKGKKQVNIKETQEPSQMQVGNDGKTEFEKLQESVWG